jgi:hypothetical protein
MLEVHVNVSFHEADKLKKELHFLPIRIRVSGHAFEPIDITDQHLVLGVNQRVSGFKLFAPSQHGWPAGGPVLIAGVWRKLASMPPPVQP